MKYAEYEKWYEQNCLARKKYYSNNIEYELVTMRDGWIGIIEVDNGYYLPRIQARDFSHAYDYCAMTERIDVPIQRLC